MSNIEMKLTVECRSVREFLFEESERDGRDGNEWRTVKYIKREYQFALSLSGEPKDDLGNGEVAYLNFHERADSGSPRYEPGAVYVLGIIDIVKMRLKE
ncbi:MAG: hypothetical protein Q7R39_10335 [Dehalococcoidia bacterium]|nr:hypothetical protein [Dehalococcoidia bacterium]